MLSNYISICVERSQEYMNILEAIYYQMNSHEYLLSNCLAIVT